MANAQHIDACVKALEGLCRKPAAPRVSRRGLEKVLRKQRRRQDARTASWDREDRDFRDLVASAAGAGDYGRYHALMGYRKELAELMPSGGDARFVRARYDSAQTTDDNRLHWAMADGMAADAANNPGIRHILRTRARYEVANNCYAFGVGLTIANDFCGTGPRLNLTSGDETLDTAVEIAFAAWCRAVNLARLLRVMRLARRQDGEAFGLLTTNPGVEDAVQLSVQLIEADCVQNFRVGGDPKNADGIHLDDDGNPVAYDVLRVHPGSLCPAPTMQFDTWPRRQVLHWFRPMRPGQHHGVPEILPALPLYATLRRFTQATLDAAESAADMAILLHTQAGAEFEDEDGPQNGEAVGAFSTVPFQRRMYVSLPQGYEPSQMKPEQPTQQYSNFKRELAGEIGRCENVSRNVVLLDSSESNFASGQLDHRTTYRGHEIDRGDAEIEVLDRIYRAWHAEAQLVKGYLPPAMRSPKAAMIPHSWYWDSNELGDPLKMAKATTESLANGTIGLPTVYANRGQDYLKALTLAAKGYGITVPELQALIRQQLFSVKPQAPATAADENADTGDAAKQEQGAKE